MALYNPHSIFQLARLLYVRPETFGPYYVRAFNNIQVNNHRLTFASSGFEGRNFKILSIFHTLSERLICSLYDSFSLHRGTHMHSKRNYPEALCPPQNPLESNLSLRGKKQSTRRLSQDTTLTLIPSTKNMWSHTTCQPYALITPCLITHREYFVFSLLTFS